MSTTLSLVEHLLSLGRHYEEVGRDLDALQILGRLAGFHELPLEVAEEAQVRLAELHMRRGQYTRARRHLAAALLYRPQSARTHFLMATACDSEDDSDPQRAAEHYRQALALEPAQPLCLSRFGLLALRLGETEEALAALRQAAKLAGQDPEILGQVVEGLCEVGQFDEARQTLRAALFRSPRDRRFRQLWNDFQFRLLHDQQRAARDRHEATGAADGPSMVLPFVRPAPGTPIGGTRRVRRDGPSGIPAPHLPRPIHRPDQKHA